MESHFNKKREIKIMFKLQLPDHLTEGLLADLTIEERRELSQSLGSNLHYQLTEDCINSTRHHMNMKVSILTVSSLYILTDRIVNDSANNETGKISKSQLSKNRDTFVNYLDGLIIEALEVHKENIIP